MNFLKNLFGGGGGSNGDDRGLYFYVRPRGCEEVVEVRINPANDLSLQDGGGYFVKKTVRGKHRCFNPAEMTLYFDGQRNFQSSEVSGGELLEKEDFDAWEAAFEAKKQAAREQNAAVDAARAEKADEANATSDEETPDEA